MAESAPTPTAWKIRRSPTKKDVAEFIKVYNRIQREFFLNREWLASSPTKKNSRVAEAAARRELFLNEGEDAGLMTVSMYQDEGDDDEDNATSYSSSNDLFELDFTRRANLVTRDYDDEEDEHEDDPVLEFDLMGNSRWKHHMILGCKAANLLKK